jgi:hypothetical protein
MGSGLRYYAEGLNVERQNVENILILSTLFDPNLTAPRSEWVGVQRRCKAIAK